MASTCTEPHVGSNKPKYAPTYGIYVLHDGDKCCGAAKSKAVFQYTPPSVAFHDGRPLRGGGVCQAALINIANYPVFSLNSRFTRYSVIFNIDFSVFFSANRSSFAAI